MLRSILTLYSKSNAAFKRFPKIRWLSLTCTLDSEICQKDEDIVIRLATDKDIAYLESHEMADNYIIQSSLRFWHNYGIKSMYLGFFHGEETPTIFQFVFGEDLNNVYSTMAYGKMYEPHGGDSVQVENLFMFRNKRIKKAAHRFEKHLFAILFEQGIRKVRTHIPTDNLPALIWARMAGFSPDKWIVLVFLNFPGLRKLPKQFVHSPIQKHERTKYPIKMFNEKEK